MHEPIPNSVFATSKKVVKIMSSERPMEVLNVDSGVLPPKERAILWKNLCMLGSDYIECLVEMSQSKQKFHVVVLDLLSERYHTI
jgi:hypothetical protein